MTEQIHLVMSEPTLMTFRKDGKEGHFDIVDGKFDYRGDLTTTDAAKMLFEAVIPYIDDRWLDRARTKTSTDAA